MRAPAAWIPASIPASIAAALLLQLPAAQADPVDYGAPSAWLCRPGMQEACQRGLDALVVRPDGSRVAEPFVPAADPGIDCFYVYPTVSRERGMYADLAASPELARVAQSQAGRLGSRCRLFVPLYRQLTRAGLADVMGSLRRPDWEPPYRGVLAAWRWYLEHDNGGRGVVLVGHSQGTVLLRRLIAEEIDGRPAQRLLVSAFLAGSPQGAAFAHIGPCRTAGETGCVYVWGSYRAGDDAPRRLFGRAPPGSRDAVCVNPAAPGGGAHPLRPYLPRPPGMDPDGPPWIVPEGVVSAACVADRQGNVLRVSGAARLPDGMPGWGLHRWDVNLVLGDILALLDAQAAAWKTGP
ncbi:DUF3089 domain-containing protein [uncultured Massilia sp.]|uniref:DUF3089 domain-containing protein n=1 Tax=uncultured Massilia sp. TaxID=169973 RepID=UPI0025D07E18|nr:DUF3089 domain-containing protein [uncultured Massilia sp.]